MDVWKILAGGFMPHGYCLRWDGPLLFVFIIGNLGIAIAYFIIPTALRHFVGKRKDLPYPHMFRLFAAFILSCGVTHLIKVWTLYYPAYWVEAVVDLWTAGVSMITAFLLLPLIPEALKLRSPVELDAANKKLQQATEELESAKSALEIKVEELRTAKELAEHALETKSRFLATVSHEVRTPMAGIIGLTELLTFQNLGEDNNKTVRAVFDSSQRLLQILNDVLDASKLGEGKLTIENRSFPVKVVVADVAQLIKPDADKKQLQINVHCDERLPDFVWGDELRLRQILLNIGFNACKFTEHGQIEIKAEFREEHGDKLIVRFSITDTGIGIASDKLTKIFEPFEQAQHYISRMYGGTGLGLTISQNLVELMGGRIGVESELEHGSTFWFELPFGLSEQSRHG